MQNNKIGTLYVVATPIGNLQDITLRAIETLRKVDRIAAEDTRHAATLLNHFSIAKPTFSLHNFNERERAPKIKNYLLAGESIALISDAGTPLISDPGFHLIKELKAASIKIVPIPGACAAIAALSIAGLATDRFVFEGFLPVKLEGCKKKIETFRNEERTIVLYVAPHRLMETLTLLTEILGAERKGVILRELTKIYENDQTGSFADLFTYFSNHPAEQRGEIVLLIEGAPQTSTQSTIDPHEMLSILMKELPLKQAVSLVSQVTKLRRNQIYQWALKIK